MSKRKPNRSQASIERRLQYSKKRYLQAKIDRGPHDLVCRCCNSGFKSWHKKMYCGSKCQKRYHNQRKSRARGVIIDGIIQHICPNCSIPFSRLGVSSPYFCSENCSLAARRIMWAKRNALRKNAVRSGERIDPLEIFMRDGWSCKCCGVKTRAKDRGKYIDYAPELDHIIPLSKGGQHTRENVQLLCRKCNIGKGNKAFSDQLLLFG